MQNMPAMEDGHDAKQNVQNIPAMEDGQGMMQNKICKTTFCQHTAGWLLIGQEEKEDKLLTDSILTVCVLLVANLG